MTFVGVAEVAVVAAPDTRMGEHAAAFAHGRRTAGARLAGAAKPPGGGWCGPSEMAGGIDPRRGLPADLDWEGPEVRTARSPPRRNQLGQGNSCRLRCRTRSQKSSIQDG